MARVKDGRELRAVTVKKVHRSTVQSFDAACHYQGKKIQEVIAEFMRDHVEEVLGKGCKN